MVSYSFFKNTFLFSLIFIAACGNSVRTDIAKNKPVINDTLKTPYSEIKGVFKTGADNYSKYLPLLKGKKVGIVTNQTGTITQGDTTYTAAETTIGYNFISIVDFLVEKEVNLKKIYAPE